tara:strand:- start:79 stop:633 length:555 start_codon:yes stop_codon:yes gene_type:complete
MDIELRSKEGAILLGAINHPDIAYKVEADISRVKFKFPDLKRIRDAILEELPISKTTTNQAFRKKINNKINFDSLAQLHKIPHLTLHQYLDETATEENARKTIMDAVRRHNAITNFITEIESAKTAIVDDETENLTSRIQKVNESLRQSAKGTEAPVLNCDEIAKESSEQLHLMIKEKIWIKKK